MAWRDSQGIPLSSRTWPGFSSAGFSLLPEGHSKGRKREQLLPLTPDVGCSHDCRQPPLLADHTALLQGWGENTWSEHPREFRL